MKSREPRRRKDPFVWNAINRILGVLVFLGVAATIIFWFYPELVRRNEMAAYLDAQKKQLLDQQNLKKQREREVYLLENDRNYIETIARDKLDLMKEGETIFRFDPAKNSPASPTKTN